MSPINEIIMADCWVSAIVEIRMPSAKEHTINKILSAPNKSKLPSTGILNMKMLNRTITTAFIIERKI